MRYTPPPIQLTVFWSIPALPAPPSNETQYPPWLRSVACQWAVGIIFDPLSLHILRLWHLLHSPNFICQVSIAHTFVWNFSIVFFLMTYFDTANYFAWLCNIPPMQSLLDWFRVKRTWYPLIAGWFLIPDLLNPSITTIHFKLSYTTPIEILLTFKKPFYIMDVLFVALFFGNIC